VGGRFFFFFSIQTEAGLKRLEAVVYRHPGFYLGAFYRFFCGPKSDLRPLTCRTVFIPLPVESVFFEKFFLMVIENHLL